jgi:hypothetical protein
MTPEEKIVKIVDESVHTRGASVVQSGSYGALAVRSVEAEPTDPSQQNASYTISNDDVIVDTQKTISKIVGGKTFRRTLSYNVAGDLIQISTWSEV